jgi:replicative DNA helicase
MNEVERLILGTIAMDKDMRHKVYSVDPDDLVTQDARNVLKTINENINADPVELFLLLYDKYGIHPELMDHTVPQSSFDFVLQDLKLHSRQRILKSRLESLLKETQQFFDPNSAAEELTAMLNIVEHSTQGQYKKTVDACEQLIDNLENIWQNRENTLKLPYLDGLTADLFGGEFITIAGRPAMGKTAVMLNMARMFAVRKIPVGFISLEMKSDALMLRLVQKDWEKSLKYNMQYLTLQERNKLKNDIANLSNLPIFLNDKIDSNLGPLFASITMMAKAEGCKVIFIDYLQLMPTNKHDSRNNEVAEISRRLKLLAQQLGIVIIAGSQLSREVEKRPDKTPKLSDLRDSGAIEQDCDMVIFCYRPGYYYPNADESNLELIVAKQRDGVTGTQRVKFDLGRQLVTDEKFNT